MDKIVYNRLYESLVLMAMGNVTRSDTRVTNKVSVWSFLAVDTTTKCNPRAVMPHKFENCVCITPKVKLWPLKVAEHGHFEKMKLKGFGQSRLLSCRNVF